MQVPSCKAKRNNLASDNSDGTRDTQRSVVRRPLTIYMPNTRNREPGRHILHDCLQDEDAREDPKRHIDEHEELAYPAEHPVALEVVDEGEQRGEIRCGGE